MITRLVIICTLLMGSMNGFRLALLLTRVHVKLSACTHIRLLCTSQKPTMYTTEARCVVFEVTTLLTAQRKLAQCIVVCNL